MKKIDKLILGSFLGPFIMTFLVVVFILLNIHMLKYFDDIIGKDLGWSVISQLFFYFAIFNTPNALPLAVLLSALITFGNLGEHFELTAIKSLGISLTRALLPIFIFVLFITAFAFYTGNYLVPKAALEAYSLLYDIKQKKPALDLKEGAFTSSIPDISIKVAKKFPDARTIKGVLIYDHRGKTGNKEVIVADSGRMFSIMGDQYLRLELFNGYNYREGASETDVAQAASTDETMSKTRFAKSVMVFDLSSFGLMRTDKKWFQGHRIMRNLKELDSDIDSLKYEKNKQLLSLIDVKESFFRYHRKSDSTTLSPELKEAKQRRDSVTKIQNPGMVPEASVRRFLIKYHSTEADIQKAASVLSVNGANSSDLTQAVSSARNASGQLLNINEKLRQYSDDSKVFQVQWHKIIASAIACMAMFLIGAPLGAIIKKGGLGIPVLASIIFFILFYVLSLLGEKWAKAGTVSVPFGIWMANAILFLIGFVFMMQARRDARLFESDFYMVIIDRIRRRFSKKQELVVSSGRL
ncbi:MAG TPA: LptF/LptG family permease [Cyclobacteriaceae bacterium]|nr:LptF/LptG family permease [Cyclobacteriaceae bacterium]